MLKLFLSSLLVVGAVIAQETTPNLLQSEQLNQLMMQMMNMDPSVITDVDVKCNADNMELIINLNGAFSGRIYPKGLSKKTSCVQTYQSSLTSPLIYTVLLNPDCGTLMETSTVEEGLSEAVNTIVVQPHSKLVTMMAQAYNIRCVYDYSGRIVGSGVNVTMLSTTQFVAEAPPPTAALEIYRIMKDNDQISSILAAEWVNIGDLLEMRIDIGQAVASFYGLVVTNCRVFDGMGMDQMRLSDDNGCPVDGMLFPEFIYNDDRTSASTIFKAHKFPFTTSVGYECDIDFCMKSNGECDQIAAQQSCLDREGRVLGQSSGPMAPININSGQSSQASSANGETLITVRLPGDADVKPIVDAVDDIPDDSPNSRRKRQADNNQSNSLVEIPPERRIRLKNFVNVMSEEQELQRAKLLTNNPSVYRTVSLSPNAEPVRAAQQPVLINYESLLRENTNNKTCLDSSILTVGIIVGGLIILLTLAAAFAAVYLGRRSRPSFYDHNSKL